MDDSKEHDLLPVDPGRLKSRGSSYRTQAFALYRDWLIGIAEAEGAPRPVLDSLRLNRPPTNPAGLGLAPAAFGAVLLFRQLEILEKSCTDEPETVNATLHSFAGEVGETLERFRCSATAPDA